MLRFKTVSDGPLCEQIQNTLEIKQNVDSVLFLLTVVSKNAFSLYFINIIQLSLMALVDKLALLKIYSTLHNITVY